jgi:hypothetical protein
MNKINKWLGIFMITPFLVAGCGGGGGGGSNSGPVVSTQSFNVKTAITTDDASPHSYKFSGSGTVDGVSVTVTGTGETSVLSAGTFEGQTVLQQTQAINLTLAGINGTRPLNSTLTLFYLPADYTPLGSISADRYEVADLPVTFPTSAKVGDQGAIRTTKYYSDATKGTQIGGSASSYSIEADTATSVIVNLITVQTLTQPTTQTQTETVRYRLDSVGTPTLLSDTIDAADFKLTIEPVK